LDKNSEKRIPYARAIAEYKPDFCQSFPFYLVKDCVSGQRYLVPYFKGYEMFHPLTKEYPIEEIEEYRLLKPVGKIVRYLLVPILKIINKWCDFWSIPFGG